MKLFLVIVILFFIKTVHSGGVGLPLEFLNPNLAAERNIPPPAKIPVLEANRKEEPGESSKPDDFVGGRAFDLIEPSYTAESLVNSWPSRIEKGEEKAGKKATKNKENHSSKGPKGHKVGQKSIDDDDEENSSEDNKDGKETRVTKKTTVKGKVTRVIKRRLVTRQM